MASMKREPLRQGEAFHLTPREKGQYEVSFSRAVCFGETVNGGIIGTVVHTAALDFVATENAKVIHLTSNFFRPTFGLPKTALLCLKPLNSTKTMTTLQFDVRQNSHLCISGFVTISTRSLPGELTAETGWKLLPPPAPCSLAALETNSDPNYITYLSPLHPKSFRNAQGYSRYHIPITLASRHTYDHWLEPAWTDPNLPAGPTWTDDLVHFAMDACLPILSEIMSTGPSNSPHHLFVEGGRMQAAARAKGVDPDAALIWGPELLTPAAVTRWPYIISSVAISTEIKKSLGSAGERWLFLRVTAKGVRDGRMDQEITLLDKNGEVVATGHQLTQAIPLRNKYDKQPLKAKV